MPRPMQVEVDVIHNGVGYGDVADALIENDMDPCVLRPWKNPKTGKCYVSVFNGFDGNGDPKYKVKVTNAATLTKEAWLRMDEAMTRAARPVLRAWGDLQAQGLTYNIPDGMGTTILQHQRMTDAGSAALSMDALDEVYRDRPTSDLVNLPLPIVHSNFSCSARELAVSRRGRMPLDTTMMEMATYQVARKVDSLVLGTLGTYTYGGGSVYGLTNYPDRVTTTLTLPTDGAWTPETTYEEVLGMIQDLQDIYFNGPYGIYYSPGWTQYMHKDYSAAYPGGTLVSKLRALDDVSFVRKVDTLGNFKIVVFQLSPAVIRAVTGMRLTTLQWNLKGGLAKEFKVMGVMVPQMKSNSDGNTGVNDGTAA